MPASIDVASVQVCDWAQGARAAYSLIHDDLCLPGTAGLLEHAVPALRARRLRAAFAAVASACGPFREVLAAIVADGHEIVSHSLSHPHLTIENVAREAAESKRLLEAAIGESRVSFFAFPFDEVKPGTLEVIRATGYLGARGGWEHEGVNPADFADAFRLKFDVLGPYSAYGDWTKRPEDLLARHVDAAIAAGGWAIQEVHGVADDSWCPVPLAVYLDHLDRLATLSASRALWVAPPSDVIRYRLAREHGGPPSRTPEGFDFEATGPECRRLGVPLTVEVRTAVSVRALAAKQGGSALRVEAAGPGCYLVDVVPGRGPVELGGP